MTSWSHGVVEANGISVHYLRTGGTKPPVVLLHGLIANGACWTPVARDLEGELDVIMPDARGHGASSAPPHSVRYDDLASDVEGLIRDLGLVCPVLMGHSMGGMTAAVVASRGTATLGGVVLVDPTFLSPERQREVWESDVAQQHRRFLHLTKSEIVAEARERHPFRSLEIVELQAEARLKTHVDAFEVLRPPNPEYREVVRAIQVPTLLAIGDNSPVVTVEMANELCALNPRLRLERVKDAGHGLPFEQPERLAEMCRSFLRQLPPAIPREPEVDRVLAALREGKVAQVGGGRSFAWYEIREGQPMMVTSDDGCTEDVPISEERLRAVITTEGALFLQYLDIWQR